MDPQNNQSNTSTNPNYSASSMDVPPIPIDPSAAPVPPAPTPVPTTESTTPTSSIPGNTSLPVQPVSSPPPPLPSTPMDTTSSSTVVTSSSGSRSPKKLLLIIVAILILLFGILAIVKILLPKLSGGAGTTITWWGLWEDPQIVQPLIDEYQKDHPNVHIKYEQEAKDQYRERLSNSLAQGSGPDIMTLHNSWIPMFRSFVSSIPQDVMTPQDYASTFYPVMASDMTLGSGLVGIPTGYDGLGLFVNDDIFSTYAKPFPRTWNELRDTAIALTIKDDKGVIKQSGVAMGNTSNVDDWQEILALLFLQNGAKLDNLTDPVTEPLAEGALTFYTNFTKTDGVWNDTLPNSTIAFANGTVAMIVAPSWRVHDIKAIKPDLKFHVLPVPQLPKNNPDEPDITYASYWVNSVSTKSKAQTESWNFLKFLSSKESYQKLYENAAKVRAFGEPYPRIDMRDLVASDPFVGGFVSLAGNAKSWYLYDKTWDGETGINSRIGKYFEDAVNSMDKDGSSDAKTQLKTVSNGVLQVLVDYGLAAAPVAPKQ